jgi:hypothetical protein
VERISGVSFDWWSAATRLADAVSWLLGERGCQFFPSSTDGLLVDPRDLEQQAIGSVAEPLRLHGQVPAPLLLIQPTQK